MYDPTRSARELRESETLSEGLLWSVLRAQQLCGLKFRRQHPIGPYVADFACVSHRLIVEIDGGYHDSVIEADLVRQAWLIDQGWKLIRFTDEEVESDAEGVGRAIACELGLEYKFQPRSGTGSGMQSVRSRNWRGKAK
ncbi:endonuclease domain-containing protein [Aeoliella sp. SH292]|uniref:endonuclease domain-containing protein n=1 Tax=Aeoliella sp. SH292 TaxID=3454464 RepID=UPI003F9D7ABA